MTLSSASVQGSLCSGFLAIQSHPIHHAQPVQLPISYPYGPGAAVVPPTHVPGGRIEDHRQNEIARLEALLHKLGPTQPLETTEIFFSAPARRGA